MPMAPAKPCIDVGLVVSNIELSLDFYVSFLGLSLIDQIVVPFGAMHRLSYGNSLVKLIVPPTSPPVGDTGIEASIGIRYITFEVNNIEDVFNNALERKMPIALDLHEMRPGVRVVMLHDPDGNVVELVQRD